MHTFIRRHSVLAYFALTFALSWMGALLIAAPRIIRGEALTKASGILLFPVMIVGPCIAGTILTYVVDGNFGLRRLIGRGASRRVAFKWYLAVALPPLLIWGVLFSMSRLVSPHFAPNLFWPGVFFGLPAGFIEEIGWTGFALPHMIQGRAALWQSVLLGLLWGVWHLPAIDFLGAPTPHGSYLFPFFLTFTLALTGLRVLMAWLYVNTRSVLLVQLVHVSSTGSLVAFSPPGVTAGEEALWYLGYAGALWAVVTLILLRYGRQLTMPSPRTT